MLEVLRIRKIHNVAMAVQKFRHFPLAVAMYTIPAILLSESILDGILLAQLLSIYFYTDWGMSNIHCAFSHKYTYRECQFEKGLWTTFWQVVAQIHVNWINQTIDTFI